MDDGEERPQRRSQVDRRVEMRRRLAAATLDALAEHGHAGASLSVILTLAGVSRGAWAHHFDNKAEMLALAAEGLLRDAVAATRSMPTGALPATATASGQSAHDQLAAMVAAVWTRFYTGRHRDLLFEVVLAARTDEELRIRLAPIFQDFLAGIGNSWGLHLRPHDGDDVAVADLMILTVYMLRGMALQELAAGPVEAHASLRALWVRMLAGWLGQ